MAGHTPVPWEFTGGSIQTVATQEPRYIMEIPAYIGSLSSPRGPEQRDIDGAFIVNSCNSHDNLVAFARNIINSALWGGDWSGAEIQDLAQKWGLLRWTKYDPDVHGGNEFGVTAGDDWLEFTDALAPTTEAADADGGR